MAPVSGVRVPASTFIRVDLPAPLWPTSPRHSPAPTARSTPARARTAPKLFATPFRLTICPGCVPIVSSYLTSLPGLTRQSRADWREMPGPRPRMRTFVRGPGHDGFYLLRAGDYLLGVVQRVLGVGDAAL